MFASFPRVQSSCRLRFCWLIKQLLLNILDIGSACLTSHFWLLLTLERRKRAWGGRNMVGSSMCCDGMLMEQDEWWWIPKTDMVIKIKPFRKLRLPFPWKKLVYLDRKLSKVYWVVALTAWGANAEFSSVSVVA